MWLEAIREPEADSACCPTCGGIVRRRIFGEMYAGSFILDGKRVEIRKRPAAGFHDPISIDPITQYFNGKVYRLFPSERYFRNQRTLHRDVWTTAFGRIPARTHIHHRNSDIRNNRLANLECIDGRTHLLETAERRIAAGTFNTFGPKARDSAAEWHASEEGRLWHSRHAIKSKAWTKWKRVDEPCDHCGKVFPKLIRKNGKKQRFCGPNCKASAFRKRHPGYRSGS
jgi:hypothetical protein